MIGEMVEELNQADINNKKYFYIIFTILVLAVSLFGLNGSLQNVDEVLFARTARESLEEGSWLIQIKDGKQAFFKSPMVFWTAMVSFKILGVSDFSARLPCALANIVSSFIILFICIKIFKSYKTGLLAVFMYLCSLQVYASSHQINTDSLVQMFLLLSLFFSIKGIKDNKNWFLLAGFFNGFAYLSKSALGFALLATVFIYIIIQRRGDLWVHFILFLCVSVLFSLPYYLYVYYKIPGVFKENFITHYLLNIVYSKGKHGIFKIVFRFLYYLGLLVLFISPFTPGLFFIFSRRREETTVKAILWNDLSKLVSIYLLIQIIGFSLIRQKMAHYTLFMIPGMVIFMGDALKNLKNKKIYIYLASMAALILGIFIFFYGKEGQKYPTFTDVVYGLITIYSLFIIFNLVLLFKKIEPKSGVFYVVFTFFIMFTVHTAITIPLDFNRDIKNFADVYKGPAPIVVISTKKVNEGSKTRATIWYLRKRSKQYKTLDHFLKNSDKIEKGTYLIFNKGYTEDLKKLYESFKVLKTGKIWSIGIAE